MNKYTDEYIYAVLNSLTSNPDGHCLSHKILLHDSSASVINYLEKYRLVKSLEEFDVTVPDFIEEIMKWYKINWDKDKKGKATAFVNGVQFVTRRSEGKSDIQELCLDIQNHALDLKLGLTGIGVDYAILAVKVYNRINLDVTHSLEIMI